VRAVHPPRLSDLLARGRAVVLGELVLLAALIGATENWRARARRYAGLEALDREGAVAFLLRVRLLALIDGRVTCNPALVSLLMPHLSGGWPGTVRDRDRYLLAALALVAVEAWMDACRENVPDALDDPDWLKTLVTDAVAGVDRAEPELKLLRN
jgi:hypothetical protein